MKGIEALRAAASSLAANPLRSCLTVSSITIGAFAIVLMSSLAESGLATLAFGIEDLGGARLLLLAPKEPEHAEAKQAGYERGFPRAERAALVEGVPHVAEYATFSTVGRVDLMNSEGARAKADLVAGDVHFLDVFKMRIARGRAFTDEEDRGRARACVVGHKVAAALWAGDPIGRWLDAGPVRCRVIGELRDNDRFGVGFGFDWREIVVAPLELVADLKPDEREGFVMMVKTDAPSSNEPVKRVMNARLVERHHGIDDFTFYDFSGVMAKFGKIFAILEVIVGLLAGIALVIGGVGVMNMMLVGVAERVREIGLRKALGARPRDIAAQFLVEAALVSFAGGAFGAASGAGLAALAAPLLRRAIATWQGTLSLPAIVVALVVSALIGISFGLAPARRAARLDPVVAMRR